MEIPDVEVWTAVGIMASSLFGYILYNERTRLTRTEHRDIHRDENKLVTETLKRLERSINDEKRLLQRELEGSVAELKSSLAEVKRMLEEESTVSDEYRRRISDAVHAVRLKLAIVQTRLGIKVVDEEKSQDDSGNFKGLG